MSKAAIGLFLTIVGVIMIFLLIANSWSWGIEYSAPYFLILFFGALLVIVGPILLAEVFFKKKKKQ